MYYFSLREIKHKLLKVMRERESRRLLEGVVFADDAVLGGEHAAKPDRGSENKEPLIAAVELDDNGDPQHVRFDAIEDYRGDSFVQWARSALDRKAHQATDSLASFNAAGAQVPARGAIIVGGRNSSELEPFRWVNIVLSNVKTSLTGRIPPLPFRQVPAPLSCRGPVPRQPPFRLGHVGRAARAHLLAHSLPPHKLAAACRGRGQLR